MSDIETPAPSEAPDETPPALQDADKEIAAIFEKYDLVGGFILCDEGGTMHRLKVSATWSCAHLVEHKGKRRLDFTTVLPEKRKVTALAFVTLRDRFMTWAKGLTDYLEELEKPDRH